VGRASETIVTAMTFHSRNIKHPSSCWLSPDPFEFVATLTRGLRQENETG